MRADHVIREVLQWQGKDAEDAAARKAILDRARKRTVPLEDVEQSFLMQWCHLSRGTYPDLAWIYAIPNFSGHYGTDRSRLIAGKKLKQLGRKKGYPDLGLDVAKGSYHGLRIELKRCQGGTVSPEQHQWHDRLRAQGYCVLICRGWEAASRDLLWYLSLPTPSTSPCQNPSLPSSP